MEKFINKHNILHDCQFGFRAGRSPSMALLSLIENITTSLDDHKHAVGVFMDIKKAFDTIDHNILLPFLAWTSGRIPTKWSLSLPPGGRDCWLPHDSGAGLCWQHVGGVGSTTTTIFYLKK